ncbi:MAG: hypothetical protein ACOY3L_18195 [Pseudomonadota bacterium]
MNTVLTLYGLWVLLPGLAGAAIGAAAYRRNRFKGALLGAAAGLALGQTTMLALAPRG